MRKFVGVTNIVEWRERSHHAFLVFLKRQAIFFDQITIPSLFRQLDFYRDSLEDRQFASELEWLHDQNILLDTESLSVNVTSKDLEFVKELETFRRLISYSRKGLNNLISKKNTSGAAVYLGIAAYGFCRFESIILRISHSMDAFPIIDELKLPSKTAVTSRKAEIIKIILNFLPIPDELVSWEQILDYRNDPDSKERALSLRRWINRLSGEKLSIAEIQDEVEWLMNEYQKHMNLHKMKVNLMTLEAFVKAPLELIENLVKIK